MSLSLYFSVQERIVRPGDGIRESERGTEMETELPRKGIAPKAASVGVNQSLNQINQLSIDQHPGQHYTSTLDPSDDITQEETKGLIGQSHKSWYGNPRSALSMR